MTTTPPQSTPQPPRPKYSVRDILAEMIEALDADDDLTYWKLLEGLLEAHSKAIAEIQ